MAYLTSCVRNRSRCHLPHAYNRSNTCLHPGLIWSCPCTSIVLNNIGTITISVYFIGGGGGGKYCLKSLKCDELRTSCKIYAAHHHQQFRLKKTTLQIAGIGFIGFIQERRPRVLRDDESGCAVADTSPNTRRNIIILAIGAWRRQTLTLGPPSAIRLGRGVYQTHRLRNLDGVCRRAWWA